jgi:hypothetical protein
LAALASLLSSSKSLYRWRACAAASVQAADRKDAGRYLAAPLKGDYYVYGGTIGDKTAPASKDRKVSLMARGSSRKTCSITMVQMRKTLASRVQTTGDETRATLRAPGPRPMDIRAI